MSSTQELAKLLIRLGISAEDLRRGMDDAEGTVQRGTSRMKSALSNFAQAAADDFGSAGGAVGALANGVAALATGRGGMEALYGALKTAVVGAAEFNAQMANVATLIPENSARIQELSQAVSDMSVELGKDTGDLTGGLYQVISAFGDSADTAKVLESNAKAAAAGLASVTDAVNLTSAVTKAYGDTSDEAVGKVADLAFLAVRLGQTTFPELAASIGRVTPLTAALKVSQEELFGTMATFTGVTGSAAEVSTQLRGVLQALMAPTDEMSALMRKLGYQSGEAMIKQLGLKGTVDAIVQASVDSHTPLQKYIGSIEGQTLALAAAGGQAQAYAEKLAATKNASGEMDKAFRAQTEGVGAAMHKWDQFIEALDKLGRTIGSYLLPPAEKFLDVLISIVKTMDKIISNPAGDKAWADFAAGAAAHLGEGMGGFAAGAVVQGPQLALIGEGSYSTPWGKGAEAVVPLHGDPHRNLAGIIGLAGGGIVGGGAQYAPQVGRRGVTTAPARWDEGMALVQALLAQILGGALAQAGSMLSGGLSAFPREFVGPPSPGAIAAADAAFAGAAAGNGGINPFTGRAMERPGEASARLESAVQDTLDGVEAWDKAMGEWLDSVQTMTPQAQQAEQLQELWGELTGFEQALTEAAPVVTRTEMAFQVVTQTSELLASRIQPLLGSIQIADDAILALAPHVQGATESFALMQQDILQATGVVYGLSQLQGMRNRQEAELTLLTALDALAQGTTLASQMREQLTGTLLSAIEPPSLLSDVMQQAAGAAQTYTDTMTEGTVEVAASVEKLAAGFGGAGAGLLNLGAGFSAVGAAATEVAEQAAATDEFLRSLYGTGPGSKFKAAETGLGSGGGTGHGGIGGGFFPGFSEGGIVTDDMLGVLHGRRQPEAVIPLDRLQGMLGGGAGPAAGSNRPIDVYVDGQRLFRILQDRSFSHGAANLDRL